MHSIRVDERDFGKIESQTPTVTCLSGTSRAALVHPRPHELPFEFEPYGSVLRCACDPEQSCLLDSLATGIASSMPGRVGWPEKMQVLSNELVTTLDEDGHRANHEAVRPDAHEMS
jgi:hypothetical protein